jgi:hypothetical protein
MAFGFKTRLNKHMKNETCLYAICDCHGHLFTNKEYMKDHKDADQTRYPTSKKQTIKF